MGIKECDHQKVATKRKHQKVTQTEVHMLQEQYTLSYFLGQGKK